MNERENQGSEAVRPLYPPDSYNVVPVADRNCTHRRRWIQKGGRRCLIVEKVWVATGGLYEQQGRCWGLGGGSVLQRSSIKTQTGLSSKWHDTIRMLAGGRMGGVERWAWETHKVCMREDYISRFQNYQCAIVQRFLFSLVETSRWGQLYNEWLCWTISKGETRFDSPFEVPISRFFVFYDARTWQVNICCVDFSPSDDIHERNVVSRCVGLETSYLQIVTAGAKKKTWKRLIWGWSECTCKCIC